MPTRRELMLGTIATGIAMRTRDAFAKASQPATAGELRRPRRRLRLPHAHPRRPREVSVLHGARLHARDGAAGGDGGAPQEPAHSARGHRHAERLRDRQLGLPLRHEGARGGRPRRRRHRRLTPESELDAMHRAGMRGIRLNLATSGIHESRSARRRLRAAAERMARRNWHVQIYTTLPMISAIRDLDLRRPPCRWCSTTSAARRPQLGVHQPGFADLVELVRSGRPTSRSRARIVPRRSRRTMPTSCRSPRR